MITETQRLLADYVTNGSDKAFRELVSCYLGLVHSTATRLLGADSHLVPDVVQSVFVDLARTACVLSHDVMLGGWLHRHTCYVARKALRGERRRQTRERQAVEMNNLLHEQSETNLAQISHILDDAINQLGAKDRTAILLRFFERHDFRAIGQALGSNEDAAQKRLARALEKLRALLIRRGVTFSAAALASTLTADSLTAAPAGMAAGVAGVALAKAASGGGFALMLLKLTATYKLKIGILCAVAAVAVATPLVLQHQTQAELRSVSQTLRDQADRMAGLQAENERLSNQVAQAIAAQKISKEQLSELLRLRGEVGVLRNQKSNLERSKTEQTARSTAASGQVETQMSEASIRDACIRSLRQLDGAKQQWALESNKDALATPVASDIAPYCMPGIPSCPAGGTYTIGAVFEDPRCSIAGHKLPDKSPHDACIGNMWRLKAAAIAWSQTNNMPDDAVPAMADLVPFLVSQRPLVCPEGGTYTLRAVSQLPKCSIPGHNPFAE